MYVTIIPDILPSYFLQTNKAVGFVNIQNDYFIIYNNDNLNLDSYVKTDNIRNTWNELDTLRLSNIHYDGYIYTYYIHTDSLQLQKVTPF